MARGAGKKSDLIIVERETQTRAAGGSMTSSWAEIGRFWAEPRYVRAGEQTRQGAVRELSVYKFIVLTSAVEALAITTKDRLDWRGEKYNIREVPRRTRAAVESEIIAEAGVTQ